MADDDAFSTFNEAQTLATLAVNYDQQKDLSAAAYFYDVGFILRCFLFKYCNFKIQLIYIAFLGSSKSIVKVFKINW